MAVDRCPQGQAGAGVRRSAALALMKALEAQSFPTNKRREFASHTILPPLYQAFSPVRKFDNKLIKQRVPSKGWRRLTATLRA